MGGAERLAARFADLRRLPLSDTRWHPKVVFEKFTSEDCYVSTSIVFELFKYEWRFFGGKLQRGAQSELLMSLVRFASNLKY